MIKENQRILNSLLVVIDVLVILFSLILAYYVRFKTTLFGPLGVILALYALFDIHYCMHYSYLSVAILLFWIIQTL